MFDLINAKKYITDLVLNNDEVKKFPNDFVTASMQWMRSWFLVDDDPVTKNMLENEALPAVAKEAVIEAKLKTLESNPTFVQELGEKLVIYKQHKSRLRNVIELEELDLDGDFRLGSSGDPTNLDKVDEENVIRGGKFKVKGDFRVGNDNFSDGNIN